MKRIVIATSALVLLTGCSASDSSQTQANTTGVTPLGEATSIHPAPLHSSAPSDPTTDGLLGRLDLADAPVEWSPFHRQHDGVELPSSMIPIGTDAHDVAARVALSAYIDPDWAHNLTADLDPAYAELAGAARRGATTSHEFGPLQLITVDVSVDEPDTLFVAFDEITDIQSIRHVTAITFADAAASRPLVINIEPIA